PNDGGTFGSRTTPSTIPQIRSAVATAREALLDIASKKLQLPREEIELRQGEFIHVNSGAKTDLSELAQDRA
ncbi:MAG: molybdopterin-dependent oxidoreductase, partial [Burkholderiales bacterium]|nr:molybdopterin-dependent oxidoreductase [Burkholderiales bacterium]